MDAKSCTDPLPVAVRENGVALRPLTRDHLAATLQWANDPHLADLLDRPAPISEVDHQAWWNALSARTDTQHFAIVAAGDGRHIGNVWLADINHRHRKAEVRIVIGDRDDLGQGAGREAIRLISEHAFGALHLHRVYAFVLAHNPRARRAFERSGFTLEGTLRDDRPRAGAYVDVWLLARLSGTS